METAWILSTIASLAASALLTGLAFFLLNRIYLKKWQAVAFLYGVVSRLACSAIAYGILMTVISIPFIFERLTVNYISTIGMLLSSLLLAVPATLLFRKGIIRNGFLLFSANTIIFLIYNRVVGGAFSSLILYLFYN